MEENLYEKNVEGNYEFYLNITIRKCIRGEIYDGAINTYLFYLFSNLLKILFFLDALNAHQVSFLSIL